ncbi:MAG: TolC family protein [Bacteroidota bacterium]
MNKTNLFAFFVYLFLSNNSFAQTAAVQAGNNVSRITLQKAVDIALKNNVQVKQSMVSVQNSELILQQSKNNKLPSVNGYTGLSTNFGRGIDFLTNTYTNQTISNNNLGINTDLVIYQGGLLQNTIKKNELDLKATEQDLLAMKNNTALNVVLAYLNILNFEDQLTIAQSQSDITKQQIDRTEKLVRAGSLPQSNVFDLKAQLANEETTIVNSQSNLDIAKLNLIQLMNDPNTTTIELDRISITAPTSEAYGSTATQVYNAAEDTQPAILASDFRTQSTIYNMKMAEAGFKPSLSFSAGAGSGYSSSGKDIITREKLRYFTQLNRNLSENVGLNLNIPIFNKFRNKTSLAQANLQKINAELTAQNARLTLRQNIEQAYVNMNNAAKRFDALTVQVTALEESFRAADSRYNAGAIDFVSYNLQKTNLDKAKANQVQAKYDYVFRTKILDFYQNKPLTF